MISIELVLELHDNLVLDGECLDGIREKGLLESAIIGQNWYEDVIWQYVHVAYSINAGHIFADGNKRTCFLVLKSLNLLGILFNDSKLSEYILLLAKNTIPKEQFFFQVCSCIVEDKRNK